MSLIHITVFAYLGSGLKGLIPCAGLSPSINPLLFPSIHRLQVQTVNWMYWPCIQTGPLQCICFPLVMNLLLYKFVS